MKSNKIMTVVEKELSYINMAFVKRVRLEQGWGVFIPCSGKEDAEALLSRFGGGTLDHNMGAGVVVFLDAEESMRLDEAQERFEADGGYGRIR